MSKRSSSLAQALSNSAAGKVKACRRQVRENQVNNTFFVMII